MLKKIIYTLAAIAFAGSVLVNIKLYTSSRNIAFVDTSYLFNNFKMKEEMEEKFNSYKQLRQQQLDSLYDKAARLRELGRPEPAAAAEKAYLDQRQLFAEGLDRLKGNYDEQIWNRLNTYVKEYGDKNGLDLILGANGSGSLMHGKENMNISKQVVDYVNAHYDGK